MTYEVIVGVVHKELVPHSSDNVEFLKPLGSFPEEFAHLSESIGGGDQERITWFSSGEDGASDWIFKANSSLAEPILGQISSLIGSSDEAVLIVADLGSYQVNPVIFFPKNKIKQQFVDWLGDGVPVGSTVFILR